MGSRALEGLVRVHTSFVRILQRLKTQVKEIKVKTFRIDYLIRGPKVEELGLQPIPSPPGGSRK